MGIRGVAAVLSGLMFMSCTPDAVEPSDPLAAASPEESVAASDAPKRCSRENVALEREDVRGIAFARGSGPVFVGLGSPNIVNYTQDTKQHDGWYYYKTLWAISPEYEGAVTVTGERLDGSEELRFNAASGFPGEKLQKLKFEESVVREWRYGPGDTLIRADGCYAFRIEGEGFVEWVTFVARP